MGVSACRLERQKLLAITQTRAWSAPIDSGTTSKGGAGAADTRPQPRQVQAKPLPAVFSALARLSADPTGTLVTCSPHLPAGSLCFCHGHFLTWLRRERRSHELACVF